MEDTKEKTKPKVIVTAQGLYPRQYEWIEKTVTKQNRLGIAMDRSKLIRWLIDKEIEAEKLNKMGAK